MWDTCGMCNGSGEYRFDGSICPVCKGNGELYYPDDGVEDGEEQEDED